MGASPRKSYDLCIIGAGIVGLAHALAAAKRGKRVVVIERSPRANGASIRNFGFVTVTGQQRGESWRLARRTRDIWDEIAPRAGIEVEHRGLYLTLRRPEALAVAQAFLDTEMGEGCRLLDPSDLRSQSPQLAAPDTLGALFSPHDMRVESRTALPRLVAWLSETLGVDFITGAAAVRVTPPIIQTSRSEIEAEAAIICPGDDFASLFPERIEAYGVERCRLSMLRLADPGFRLPGSIMSDLSLTRYRGYADLPQAVALKQRLAQEQPRHLANGVHLIMVQSADGSLVVGDSHHYGDQPWPFAPVEAEAMILDEFAHATGFAPPPVIERWTGEYASTADRNYFIDAPSPEVRLVMVTSGTGASTAFGIAEKTLADLYGPTAGDDL